jgi:hypothetical protein
MTIPEIISTFKEILKLNHRSPEYTDSYLWSIFLNTRAEILNNNLKKNYYINPNEYKTFVLPLITVNKFEGTCIELDCPVKSTNTSIPAFLKARNSSTLSVFTPTDKEIPYRDVSQIEYSQYNDIKSNKIAYTFDINNKLIILNNDLIKCVKVKALWDNILDFQNLQDPNSCVDLNTVDIGLSRDSVNDIIKLTLNTYFQSVMPSDNSNNSNS